MTHQLVCQKQNSLETEFAVAEVEEVFERRTEEIDYHCVVVAFRSKPADERNADATRKGLVDFGLVLELRVFGFDGLKLDGHFFPGNDVDAEVDVTCGDHVRRQEHTQRDVCMYSPKEPEPIFFPKRYFPPTRRSSFPCAAGSDIVIVG